MEKIALFLPSLNGGGAQRAMLNLSRGFSARGIEVHLVLSKATGPYLNSIPKEVKLVDLGAGRVITSLPALVGYLRREKPEAILSTLGHANLIALWASRFSGVSVKTVFREATTVSRSLTALPKLRGLMLLQLARWFYPYADGIIATSHGVENDLIDCVGVSKNILETIYSPIQMPEILEKSHQPVQHAWLINATDEPVVLSVGRLHEAKDYPTLLEAFSLVLRKHKAKLIILGEGRERSNLESMVRRLGIQDDVDMPGFEINPYSYMSAATVFVLSSAWEGLPNALIESMAVGTPVIATDCKSGPREILNNGKYGKLIPVGDVNALSESIIDVIVNHNFTLPNKEWLNKFSMDTCIDKYINFIQNTQKHSRNPVM